MNKTVGKKLQCDVSFASRTAALIDGLRVTPTTHRWSAQAAARRATTSTGLVLTSTVTMAFEQPMLLFDLELDPGEMVATAGSASATINLTVLAHPQIRQQTDFPWVMTYPNHTGQFEFRAVASKQRAGSVLLPPPPHIVSTDTKSAAMSSFQLAASGGATAVSVSAVVNASGQLELAVALPAGGAPIHVRFALTFGNRSVEVLKPVSAADFEVLGRRLRREGGCHSRCFQHIKQRGISRNLDAGLLALLLCYGMIEQLVHVSWRACR